MQALPIYTDARGVESTRPPAGQAKVKLTLSAAIAAKLGDEKKLVASYRRSRLAYQNSRASCHTFSRAGAIKWRLKTDADYRMALSSLESAAEDNDTQRYVAAFCKLNHLKA